MDEEEKTKEIKKEDTVKNNDVGSEPKTTELIDRANEAAKRLEEANKKQEELLTKQEELMARQTLAGKAEAGQGSIKKEEQTPEEYAQDVLDGKVNPLK